MSTENTNQESYKDIKVEFLIEMGIEYLIHYAAPCTGCDMTFVTAGSQFQLTGNMNDDNYYAIPLNNQDLAKNICREINAEEGELKGLCIGISFFISKSLLKSDYIKYLSGDIGCI